MKNKVGHWFPRAERKGLIAVAQGNVLGCQKCFKLDLVVVAQL